MEKYYRFAGAELCVRVPDAYAYRWESRLEPFAIPFSPDPWVFEFEPASALPEPSGSCVASQPNLQVWESPGLHQLYLGSTQRGWQSTRVCVRRRGTHHSVQFLPGSPSPVLSIQTVLEAINAAHLVSQAGGVILHCSYIAYKGRAILFTAPSGVGKSTQARLWQSHRGVDIINGDRAAFRIEGDVVMAQAIPFAGSSEYCQNISLPLGAVVCLGQASHPQLQPLTGARAFRRIWEGCTVNLWDPQDVALSTQAVTDLIRRVPVCRLDCPPDETAVAALENYLAQVMP